MKTLRTKRPTKRQQAVSGNRLPFTTWLLDDDGQLVARVLPELAERLAMTYNLHDQLVEAVECMVNMAYPEGTATERRFYEAAENAKTVLAKVKP